jgi:hypothetical protein
MKKNTKFILIGLIAIFSFSFLLIYSFIIVPQIQSSINQVNGDERVKQFEVANVTVVIDYSGVKDNELFENINLTNYRTTAYYALANCCDVSVQDFGWGLYVNEINGVGPGWIYSINDDPPPNIPSNYFYLMDNDTVKWKHV